MGAETGTSAAEYYGIPPHGGVLVDRVASPAEAESLKAEAGSYPAIPLSERTLSDVEMIASGVFSPLEGFMVKKDYDSVVKEMKLANGLVWSIPVTLPVSREGLGTVEKSKRAKLTDWEGETVAVLEIDDIYEADREKEAQLVYRTQDRSHPGVEYLHRVSNVYAGGRITLLGDSMQSDFPGYRMSPRRTREAFKERGWKRIVGFQTRNPVHRAHEYLLKSAMEIVDGLFLNPLVGETKRGDIPACVRMQCYEVLLEKYFPGDRVVLAVLGAAMRYAGPREAIFHALARKNFGCTHFIVGRDHAGVGNFYGTFDAQKIFDEFTSGEIGITPLFFDHSFYCYRCGSMASVKTCPHGNEDHLALSGTKVRELLGSGEIPPPEFTRPEIADILIDAYRKGVL